MRTNIQLLLTAFALALAILAAHAWIYRQFMVDDSFISLRYSDRFLHGQGLTWNDGELVEGYSNLLWVLGCAFLGFLGIDLVATPRFLGFFGFAATIAAILWAYRSAPRSGLIPGLFGALAVVLSGAVAVWTMGGLEQPLLAGLLAWALALTFPLCDGSRTGRARPLVVGVLLGLIAITRPDGIGFTFAIAAAYLVARGRKSPSWGTVSLIAIPPVLFLTAQLAFRLLYYHDWLPNSAYAKVAFTTDRVWAGLTYVGGGVYSLGLVIPALASMLFVDTSLLRRRAIFLGIVLAIWLAYLIFIGGDFFPGHRHLIPAIVVLAYLFALTVEQWLARYGLGRTLAAGALCLVALTVPQFLDPKNALARHERWVWDGEAVGKLLYQAFGAHRPLLAADSGGCIPFFSRLPSIDMLGINDHYLAHHRPHDFGKGVIGHELGNGAYVLSRRPDLVLFNLPTGGLRPYFRSGREMVFGAGSNFLATFRPATFESETPSRVSSIMWVRTEGGPLGIQQTKDSILVPGYLFSSNRNSVMRLDSEGRIGVTVTQRDPAVFFHLGVPEGTWRLRCESSGDSVDVKVWDDAAESVLTSGIGSSFTAAGLERWVTLTVQTKGPSDAYVRTVILEHAH